MPLVVRSAGRRGDAAAEQADHELLIAEEDGVSRWCARLVRRELTFLPGRALRRAELSFPESCEAGSVASFDREVAMRALLAYVAALDPRPDVIALRLPATQRDAVEAVWRAAVAHDAECAIRGGLDGLEISIALPGLVSNLGRLRGMLRWRDLRAAIRARRTYGGVAAPSPLLYLMRPSDRRLPALATPLVEWRDVPVDEIDRRPVRFGWQATQPVPDSPEHRCLAGVADGDVVFRLWTVSGETGRRCVPEAVASRVAVTSVVFVMSAWTAPAWRGQGLFPAALDRVAARARREGIEQVWIAVAVHNAPSRAAIQKAGFDLIATVDP